MWTRITGKSDGSKDRDDEKRKKSDSTRRSKGPESMVSSSSSRRPSGRETKSRAPESVASSYATFATARDDRDETRSNADLYDEPRDDDRRRRRRDDDERSTYSRKERSRSRDRSDRSERDRSERDRKKDKEKREKKKSRSEAGGSRPQELVESPRRATRSVSGQMETGGFSQYPAQNGPPLMSGALPMGTMSSHVPDQFPGQDPAQYATPFMPPQHTNSFGEAAEYYGDQGESVHAQPGVRPDQPSVLMPLDTPHLMAASSQANPVADTGSGAAAEFYGGANIDTMPAKPPRPSSSSMPGAFNDEPSPPRPPRPGSKPDKPSKLSAAATMAGAAGIGYAVGHNSSQTQHSTNYTNGAQGASASMYYHGDNASIAATDGSQIPTYSEAMAGNPPAKPPRPGKPEKKPSGSSHAGLYTAGAAAAAYGLAHHNSHHHSSSMPGGFPSDYPGGPSPSPFMSGSMAHGMAHRHEHKGPASKFADWWKNHDDVRKMEEYTEYIGVCRGCFDPRSNPMDAPRKHHYNRKRSGEFRPSGIREKHSRYGLSEKASRISLSGDEKRVKRKSSNGAGWIAAGLGSVGLVQAGKALWNHQRDDFDDTYSVKSGRESRSRVYGRSRSSSRSRSRDRKHRSSGRSEIRHRSPSRDRMSRMSVGVTGDRKDYKIVRHRSRSRSRSRSRDRRSGLLGAAMGVGLAASAAGASRRKHRSRSRSRSHSPRGAFVRHRRGSGEYDRRHSKSNRISHKSSRSSVGSGSFIDVSRTSQPQGGFLGGFFAAPPPKEPSRRKSHSRLKKKKKGFFNFGNSSSSSESELAFGQGFVRQRKKPSRRTSDERLNAALLGLGATTAAITAAKAGRDKGRHRPEVVAVREHRHQRRSGDHRRPGTSRYDEDGWEDLPDDGTSSESGGSISSGLAFGDYDWKKGKSTESLASNGSGTNKWGWRWGSKKQKKKSSDSLYNSGANASFVGPAAVGAVAGAAIGTGLSRHDSSASSVHTLQNVYPVASNDPTKFDARRTSSVPTPQPLVTSRPDSISIQQPQPIHQVPGTIYSTQAPPQPSYIAPSGPPVFSHGHPSSYPVPTGLDEAPNHPPLPRRANSSPGQSSWKRDAAIAGIATGVGAAAIAATKNRDRSNSSTSNVRFELTKEQARKEERERRKQRDRDGEEERRRRQDEDERKEQERKRRQEEEARRFLETERLAMREAERKHEREQQQRAREAEERERQARIEAQRQADMEREAEKRRVDRREAERRDAERREAEIREDTERRRREQEAAEYSQRYESDRDRYRLEQQLTGSSVASDVRRKERELEERERDITRPDPWKSTVAAAGVVGAAAAITNAAISSSKRPNPAIKKVEPPVQTIEPSQLAQDYADDDIFDPDMFKKKKSTAPSVNNARDVFEDWHSRYMADHEPVSQADFFAPKELLEHTAPSPKIDPNEGATDLHVYEAHSDLDLGPPKVPPYPPSYSFTATRDGRGSQAPSWTVPSLNLIQPTPPSSRTNSVRGASVPPSPVIEPQNEPKREEPKQAEASRRSSRVSWGENQFHNYEVPTPDSHREQYISDYDLKDHSKQSQDEIVVERDSPKSGKSATSYRPEKEPKRPEPEVPTSTQYVPDQEEDSWAGTMSKKASKKEKKKAKAAAAAAVTAATMLARDNKSETSSTVSDPFSDKYAASTPSSIPSSSSVYQAPYYESTSDIGVKPSKPKGLTETAITAEPEEIHIPGAFADEPAKEPEQPAEDEWAVTTKKGKKNKKRKSKGTDDDFFEQDAPKVVEQTYVPEPEISKESAPEFEVKLSKKEKKKKAKAAKRASSDNWEDAEPSQPDTPTTERDIRDIEPTYTAYSPPKSAEPTHRGGVDFEGSQSEGNPSATTKAAMAGGFSGLVAAAMKQDQDRMAADFDQARFSLETANRYTSSEEPSSTSNGMRAVDESDPRVSIPSTAFQDIDELADAKTPKKKKRQSGRWSPSVGSPLRTEVQYDYVGSKTEPTASRDERFMDASKDLGLTNTFPSTSRDVHDSGYYAPDDATRMDTADRDSDEFFSAGSDERKPSKNKSRDSDKHDDRDVRSVVSSGSKYDDELDPEERRRRRLEDRPERGYEYDDGERKRRHRRRETDERSDDWDTRSTISEARSEANGERRRKHKRRESERNGSPEDRVRSSAASDPGDLYEREHKSSKRRSKRDADNDNMSVVSSPPRYDEERSSKKDKEKRSTGLFGMFSKSKESLVESSSKSSKSKDDEDDDERRRRRKKHRDRGSTYGSDDDDLRSTVSSSSRREKRRSRTDSWDDEGAKDRDSRSRYDDKEESFLGDRAVAATPLPGDELATREETHHEDSGIPGDRPEYPLPTLDDTHSFPAYESRDLERPTTPVEDSRALLTRLTGLPPWQLEAFPNETPPVTASEFTLENTPSPEHLRSSPVSERRLSSTSVPIRFRRPGASPSAQRDLTLDLQRATSPASSPLRPPGPRHSKSSSAEFTSSREYRPLYLVERNRKSAEIEEVLPALPSSGSPSRASSVNETTEDEYQSALESPHISASASDAFDDSFMDPFRFVSPPHPDPEMQHPELQDREFEELPESQQTTPKASSFPAGVLDRRDHAGPTPDALTAKLEDVMEKNPKGLGLSLIQSTSPAGPASPLAPSAPIDDTRMRDHSESRSRDSSPTKSSSLLQEATLGALIGGATAAALRHRSPSPSGFSDFMGGELDQETIEEAAQSMPNPELEKSPLPALPRTPSSKKGKKGKKGSKGKSIDFSAESPKELTAEDMLKMREKETADAVDDWFSAPVEEPKSIEEKKAEPVQVQPSADPDPNLMRRESKGKGKKKKAKSKKGSISTPSESPVPTPSDELQEPGASSSSQFLPTFLDNEDDWNKNKAESIVTDDATLVGEAGLSQYGGSPEISSKEFRRQKILDNTAPQDDGDLDARRAELGSAGSLKDFPELAKKISQSKLRGQEISDIKEEQPVDLWAATTPKLGKDFTSDSEPAMPDSTEKDVVPMPLESQPATLETVAEDEFVPIQKGKKGKKGKRGKRGSLLGDPSILPSDPVNSKEENILPDPQTQQDKVERDILKPVFDAGEAAKYLDPSESPEPESNLDITQPIISADVQLEEHEKKVDVMDFLVKDDESQLTTSTPATVEQRKDMAEPTTTDPSPQEVKTKMEPGATASAPEAASSWGQSLWGAIGWGKKKSQSSTPETRSPAIAPVVEHKSAEELTTTPLAMETVPKIGSLPATTEITDAPLFGSQKDIQIEPEQTIGQPSTDDLSIAQNDSPKDDTSLAPAEPSTPAEEDKWVLPSSSKKKDKKGKKGKRGSLQVSEPDLEQNVEDVTKKQLELRAPDSVEDVLSKPIDTTFESGLTTVTPAAIDNESEQITPEPQTVAEDEWAVPSKKKSKKVKKGRRESTQAPLLAEAEPSTPSVEGSQELPVEDMSEPSRDLQTEEPFSIEPVAQLEDVSQPVTEILQDEWASTSSKKSKKGKEKKGAKMSEPEPKSEVISESSQIFDEPASNVPQAIDEPAKIDDQTHALPDDKQPEVIPIPTEPQEEHEWAVPLSKKAKKKGKKTKTFELEPEPSTPSDDRTEQEFAPSVSVVLPTTESEALTTQFEPSAEPSASVEEDEWAIPSSKKDKKKKAKKANAAWDLNINESSQPIPGDLDQIAQLQDPLAEEPIVDSEADSQAIEPSQRESVAELVTEKELPSQPLEAVEDEWAMPTKKEKKKKGKKGKSMSSIMTSPILEPASASPDLPVDNTVPTPSGFNDDPQSSQELAIEPALQLPSELAKEQIEGEDWTAPLSKKDKKKAKKAKKAWEDEPVPIAVPEPSAAEFSPGNEGDVLSKQVDETVGDTEWDVPMSKKDKKKAKKGKKTLDVDISEPILTVPLVEETPLADTSIISEEQDIPEPISHVESLPLTQSEGSSELDRVIYETPVDVPSSEHEPRQDDVDEWAPISKKDKKKGKKGKRVSILESEQSTPVATLSQEVGEAPWSEPISSREISNDVISEQGPVYDAPEQIKDKQEQEDEWAPISKKDKKKAKKAKRASAIEDELSQALEDVPKDLRNISSDDRLIDAAPEDVHIAETQDVQRTTSLQDDVLASVGLEEKADVTPSDTLTPSAHIEQQTGDSSLPASSELQEATVDEWDLASAKRGKKGKKGKKRESIIQESTTDDSIPTPETKTSPTDKDIIQPDLVLSSENQPSTSTSIPEEAPLTTAELPIPPIEENLAEPENAEDEWAFTSNKKGKKGKRATFEEVVQEPSVPNVVPESSVEPQHEELPVIVPEASLESGLGTDKPDEGLIPELERRPEELTMETDTEQATRDVLSDVPQLTEPSEPIAIDAFESSRPKEQPVDDWSLASRKDKKSKKAKRGSGVATPTQEIVPEIQTEPSQEPSFTQTEDSQDIKRPDQPDDADWGAFSTKKDKKKGKKGKGKQSGTATPTTEIAPEVQVKENIPEPMLTAGFEEKPSDITPQVGLEEETQGLSEANQENISSEIEATQGENSAHTEPDPPVEDEWSFTTKKDKKGKKGKRTSELATPISESTPDYFTEGTKDLPVEGRGIEDVQAISAAEVKQNDDLDEWAMPSKKKKGKKGKKFDTATWNVESPSKVPIEHASKDLDTSPQVEQTKSSLEAVAEPHFEGETQPHHLDEEIKPVGEPQDIEETTTAAVYPVITPSAEPEDEWASPVSKKGKKGKRKSGVTTPIFEDSPSLLQVEPVVAPATEEQEPEDEWATLVSKKKGKKGKGKKSEPQTPVTEPAEPVLEMTPVTSGAPAVIDKSLEPTPQETALEPARNDVNEEVEQPVLSRKLSKKEKKAKKKTAAFSWDDEATPDATTSFEPEASTKEPSDFNEQRPPLIDHEVEPADGTQPFSTDTLAASRELAADFQHDFDIKKVAEAQPQEAIQEDEWSSFAQKKGKKGKKDKKAKLQSTLDWTEDAEPKPESAESKDISLQMEESVPSPNMQQATDNGLREFIPADRPFDTTHEFVQEAGPQPLPLEHFTASSASPQETQSSSERQPSFEDAVFQSEIAQDAPKEPEEEDLWAPLSRKASKKAKKGKKSKDVGQTSGTSTPLEVEPSIVTTDTIPEPTVAEEPSKNEPEDEWAFPSKKSKKDKKKAKKGKSISDTIAPAIDTLGDGFGEPPVADVSASLAEDLSREESIPPSETTQIRPGVAERELESVANEPVAEHLSVHQDQVPGPSGMLPIVSQQDTSDDVPEQPQESIPEPSTRDIAFQKDEFEDSQLSPSTQNLLNEAAGLRQRAEALDQALATHEDLDLSSSQPESMFDVVGKLSNGKKKGKKNKSEVVTPAWEEPNENTSVVPESREVATEHPAGEETAVLHDVPQSSGLEDDASGFSMPGRKLSKKDKKKARQSALAGFEANEDITALPVDQAATASELEPALSDQIPVLEEDLPKEAPEIQQEAKEEAPILSRKLSKKDKKKAKQAAFASDEPVENVTEQSPPAENEIASSSQVPAIEDIPDAATFESTEVEEAPALSRKLSKKDKKAAKRAAFAWDEPSEEGTEQSTATELGTVLSSQIPDTEETIPLTNEEPGQMEEAPVLLRKLSKKDKKKAKQAALSWDEPSTEAQETTTLPESQQSQANVNDAPTAPEESPSLARKLSKKDKKKAKQAALVWNEPEEDFKEEKSIEASGQQSHQEFDSVPSGDRGLIEDVAPLESSFEEPSKEVESPSAAPEETIQPLKDALTDAPEPVKEPETILPTPIEDEYSFAPALSRKRSKKDKKKGTGTTFDFSEPSTPSEELGMAPTDPMNLSQQVTPVDDFAVPLSKKDKKKAKKKAAAFDWNEADKPEDVQMHEDLKATEEPSINPEGSEREVARETPDQTVHDSTAEATFDSQSSKEQSVPANMPALSELESEFKDVPTSTDVPPSHTEPQPEDEWALPAKKSKKEKRKSKKSGASFEETSDFEDKPSVQAIEPMIEQSSDQIPISKTKTFEDDFSTKVDIAPPAVVSEPFQSAKPSKKKTKKHKLAAMFEPDTPEEVDPVQSTMTKTEKSVVKDISETPSVSIQPTEPIPAVQPRAKSPEQDIDFAATVAAGLKESGFDTNLVLNDPSFHRSTSPQGIRDVSPEEDIAAAKEGAIKSKYGAIGRSPSPTSQPEPSRDAEAAEKPTPMFDPLEILNDPTFSQRKSPPGVLEEADPEELWSSSKKGKKTKGKKKRVSVLDSPLISQEHASSLTEITSTLTANENDIVDPAINAETQPNVHAEPTVSEQIADPAETSRAMVAEEAPEEFWSSSSKKKNKKAKKEKRASLLQDTVASPTVEAPVIEAPTDVPLAVETPADSTREAELEYSSALDRGATSMLRDDVPPMEDSSLLRDQPHPEAAIEVTDDVWDEQPMKKGKKGKRNLKRTETADVESAKGEVTPLEYIGQEKVMERDGVEPEQLEEGDWTSSKKKGKKGKKGKGTVAAMAAAGAIALGSKALEDKREGDDRSIGELPPTFDQEPKSLADVEADEYPFPQVSEPEKDRSLSLEESRKETEVDEWAIPAKKKGKKGRKNTAAMNASFDIGKQEAEVMPQEKSLEELGSREEVSTHYQSPKDVAEDTSTHVYQAAVPEPIAGIHERSVKREPSPEPKRDLKISPPGKPSMVLSDVEHVKRREHPVSPEAQPWEKRLHLSEPLADIPTVPIESGYEPSISREEHRTSHVRAQPTYDHPSLDISTEPTARGHSPIIEPTWSFGAIRDSAVHVADSPVAPSDPQFQQPHTSTRDSGYHDTGYSPSIPQGPSESVEEYHVKEKRRSKEPKTSHASHDSAYLKHHDEHIRPRSPSLPELPSFAGVSSPSAVDSATKERSSHLFNSSPSTRGYNDSPSISSKPRSHDVAPIGAALAGAVIGAAVASSKSSEGDSRHSKRSHTEAHERQLSPTRDVKHEEPYQSLFGDPNAKKSKEKKATSKPETPEKSGMLSTPATKHMRTPSSQLDTIKESSPDDSPLHKKGRAISDVGAPEHGVKAARRSMGSKGDKHIASSLRSTSPKPVSERLKSPPPITPTRSSRKASAPTLDTSTPSRDSPWHQVHESVDRSMTLSPARRLPHEKRSPPSTDPTKQRMGEQRSPSVFSDRSVNLKSPDQDRPLSAASNRSTTPSLRRIDRSRSGDLRNASKLGDVSAPDAKSSHSNLAGLALAAGATAAIAAGIASSSKYDPVRDKGKGRAEMPDVYEAWGEAQGSPMSPTRPPSVRKRQSMQIIDLQSQLESLAAQNRSLEDAKAKAEETLQAANYQRDVDTQVVTEAVDARDRELHQKDIDIAQLRDTLQRLQGEVTKLTELNNSLTEANQNLTNDANQRYAQLQVEGQQVHSQWQQSTRELQELRAQHDQMANGMEGVVRSEIGLALDERNAEITRLNNELAEAKAQIQILQKQILGSKKPNESFLTVRDEDYFDSACQQLCQHVQQWVLRFSKFSDTRPCRLSSEIAADTRLDSATRQKIDTRLDNAILDGSDVDMLLADRVKRRDVFMSVVMTMIWEYVFTRYLFGMDREQRQKLKSLEKTLSEVGPTRAVAQWRAITLTLLSKREPFIQQRAQDTEAVVHEIYSTLSTLLSPPSHLQRQIQESLRNVMRLAVSLSIEMRTQRAEYIMLPPLQPEYDTNGDLIAKVTFNASLMNERSGETTSNDELEARGAIVKIVLFPLVVKKGDDFGEGDDEIVVCPAQVLVARPSNKKVVRVMSGAMSVDSRLKSTTSLAPESSIMDLSGSNVI